MNARCTLSGRRAVYFRGLAIDAETIKGKGDVICDFDRKERALIDGKAQFNFSKARCVVRDCVDSLSLTTGFHLI